MRVVLTTVVTCYQDADNLNLTLRSLAEQRLNSRREHEVVISDGGSTDGSHEIIENYSGLISARRTQPDQGVYDGMNLGADLATGEWVQFLNAGDALLQERALEELINWLRDSNSQWAICGARNRGEGRHGASRIPNIPHVWWRHAWGLQSHCHQATFFRREALLLMGGHDLQRGMVADHDLIMRFGMAMGEPDTLSSVLVDYQGGGMSEQRAVEIPGALHCNRRVRLQYGPKLAALDRMLTAVIALRNTTRVRLGRLCRTFRAALFKG